MNSRMGRPFLGAALAAALLSLCSFLHPWDTATLAAEPAAPVSTEAPEPSADPYAEPVTPLTVRQCGQCHPSIYNALRESGGKHKFPCQECHERFHVVDQEEAMPRCGNCHNLVHGEPFSDCLSCHADPHAPRLIPIEGLAGQCRQCHAGPAADLQAKPSAHSGLECTACHHDRHGYIPSCLQCHEPHFADQGAETCLSCHPAHTPLTIALSGQVDPRTCDACHQEVYRKWSATPSRHGKVPCTECHREHALIPKCAECHPAPHSEKMLAAFPDCLTCHLDAHSPPVKREP